MKNITFDWMLLTSILKLFLIKVYCVTSVIRLILKGKDAGQSRSEQDSTLKTNSLIRSQ